MPDPGYIFFPFLKISLFLRDLLRSKEAGREGERYLSCGLLTRLLWQSGLGHAEWGVPAWRARPPPAAFPGTYPAGAGTDVGCPCGKWQLDPLPQWPLITCCGQNNFVHLLSNLRAVSRPGSSVFAKSIYVVWKRMLPVGILSQYSSHQTYAFCFCPCYYSSWPYLL